MNKILVLLAVSLLLFAGCVGETTTGTTNQATNTTTTPGVPTTTNQTNTTSTQGTVKVGVALPLSGGAASYGLGAKKGIDLALAEINSKGIVSGKQITLVYEDSKCSGTDAVTAMQKLATVDKVKAVIGEMCSSATKPIVPIADQNKVLLVSPASTAPDLTLTSTYFFRTITSDRYQAKEAAKLIYGLNYTKLAILYINDDYGVGFQKHLNSEFKALGGSVVSEESFESDATDLKTQLIKIKSFGPDALLVVSNSPTPAGLALKQAKELGLNTRMFGSEGLKDKTVVSAAKGAAEGLLLTYPKPPSNSTQYNDFVAAHKSEYNSDPGAFAAESYDAMMAIAYALNNSDGTPAGLVSAMKNLSFEGASGTNDFDENGDVFKPFMVYEVKSGEFVAYK